MKPTPSEMWPERTAPMILASIFPFVSHMRHEAETRRLMAISLQAAEVAGAVTRDELLRVDVKHAPGGVDLVCDGRTLMVPLGRAWR